jgi:hypothetical protein
MVWRMKPSIALSSGLVALGLVLPAVARADVPPEPGYVESCTVEKQQGAGEACLACGDAYHGDRDACQRQHAGDGYAKRCQTRGASVWTEVWCKKGAGGGVAAGPTPAPSETKDDKPAAAPAASSAGGGKCSVVAGPGGAAGSVSLLVVLGLARRRSRR